VVLLQFSQYPIAGQLQSLQAKHELNRYSFTIGKTKDWNITVVTSVIPNDDPGFNTIFHADITNKLSLAPPITKPKGIWFQTQFEDMSGLITVLVMLFVHRLSLHPLLASCYI
jgi:hypothetical protein